MNENKELNLIFVYKVMNFSIMYNGILDKKKRDEIRRTIIRTFNIAYPTFRRWSIGLSIPPQRYWNAIAEIMGVTVAELFPTTETCPA